MKLNKRKGFTIVELVIVIAVIAILAAVLIPNISNLVKKANASADESLVRNLNTALSMDVEKHQTMDAALEAAKTNGGYDLTTIVTKNKDNKILWDSKNDCFVYMKKGASKPTYLPNTQEVKDVKDWDLFEIVDAVPGLNDQKYSIYLAGNTFNEDVNVSVGFDAGKNTNIPSVTYTAKEGAAGRSLIFNTASENTALVLNGKTGDSGDTLYHYGFGAFAEVSCGNKSFYEYGSLTGNIVAKAGHIVAKSKNNENAAAAIIVMTKDVVIDSEDGTPVAISDSVAEADRASLRNNISISGKTATEDSVKVIEEASRTLFSGGLGTKESPYLIGNVSEWLGFRNSTLTNRGLYFKVVSDLDFSKTTDKIDVHYFTGDIDFGNHTITGIDKLSKTQYQHQSYYGFIFYGIRGTSSIKNLVLEMQDLGKDHTVRLVYEVGYKNDYSKLRIENVSILGNVTYEDNNASSFVWALHPGSELSFVNCTNAVNITNNKLTGAFLGKIYEDDHPSNEVIQATKLTFKNCINVGTLRSTNDNVAMLISNSCGNGYIVDKNITIENCYNDGTILAPTGKKATLVITNATLDAKYSGTGKAENRKILSNATITEISVSKNSKFDFSKIVDASFYRLSYSGFASSKTTHGVFGMTFTFNSKDTEINAYEFIKKDSATTLTSHSEFGTTYYTTEVNGVVYYVLVAEGDVSFTSAPDMTLIAYNEDNTVKEIYHFVFAD